MHAECTHGVSFYAIAVRTSAVSLDCRALGLDDADLQLVVRQQAKIAPSMGYGFGEQGKGFIRINLGRRVPIWRWPWLGWRSSILEFYIER